MANKHKNKNKNLFPIKSYSFYGSVFPLFCLLIYKKESHFKHLLCTGTTYMKKNRLLMVFNIGDDTSKKNCNLKSFYLLLLLNARSLRRKAETKRKPFTLLLIQFYFVFCFVKLKSFFLNKIKEKKATVRKLSERNRSAFTKAPVQFRGKLEN